MENKVYKYKGKLYSNLHYENPEKYAGDLDDLQNLLERDGIITICTTTTYWFTEGDCIGTDDEVDEEYLMDAVANKGYYELEEIKDGEQSI